MHERIVVRPRNESIYEALKITKLLEHFACLAGMREPVPGWFIKLPTVIRVSWRVFVVFAECSLSIMFLSCLLLLLTTDNVSLICEGFGSLTLLFSTTIKTLTVVRHQKVLNRNLERVHSIAAELRRNPVGSQGYLKFHDKKVTPVRIYSSLRFYFTMLSYVAVNWNSLIPGLIWPREDMPTPMAGWFPIDRANRLQFSSTCVLIMIYFSLCSVRDMYVDMVLHVVLATINTQTEFMSGVLSDIVKSKSGGKQKKIHWWVRQHQEILKVLDELKPITGPVFFVAHAGNSALLFFNLVNATEDKEVNVTQLVTMLGVSGVMLFHLYLVCAIGDDITKNMRDIAMAVENEELWDMTKEERKEVYTVCIFSTKPYEIQFAGGVGTLHAEPYGNIVVKMLGYFNTIYTLRNKV